MTYDFKSDFNEYRSKVIKTFVKAKENYVENLNELTKMLFPFNETTLSDENLSKLNHLIAELGNSLSDIQAFVKYDFVKEEGKKVKFFKLTEFLEGLLTLYQSRYLINKRSPMNNFDTTHYQLMLRLLTIAPSFFIFDEETLLKNYNKYIRNSIKDTISNVIMKDPKVIVALITGIFSIIAVIIQSIW